MFSNHVTFALIFCGILFLGEYKLITAIDLTIRPPYHEYAKMARYVVHKSNWTSMGTISTRSTISGFPMVNVVSIADSAYNAKSTGHIYFLLTDLDFTAKDLAVNNKLTALFTEDQDLACTSNNTDTMDPTCARVIFTGKIARLTPGTLEHKQADEWYTNRHPASVEWRETHTFYFCKLNIEHIVVLDFYGGANYVSIDDYYNANYDANATANDIENIIHPSVIRPKPSK